MPKFDWRAKSKAGRAMKGEMEASSMEAVISKLESRELVPGKVKKRDKSEDFLDKILGMGGGVDGKTLAGFTSRLSAMIDEGLPLVQCLGVLEKSVEKPALKKALLSIKAEVESGSPFADALSKHPKIFDNSYVSFVEAGDIGGILDKVLPPLAEQIEKAERLKKLIKHGTAYPINVLTIAFVIVAILLIKVIPVFSNMFGDMRDSLPSLTLMVLNLSDWTVANWWKVILGIAAFITACKMAVKIPKVRVMLDSFYIKLPLVGSLIKKIAVARFTRTMGTMLTKGVPILNTLEICGKTSSNKIVEFDIVRIRSAIGEGKTLAEPLAQSNVFPPMVVQMIADGEQTDEMETTLLKIAENYEDEVAADIEALTSLLEPLLIVFLGTVTGGILIAMYVPSS